MTIGYQMLREQFVEEEQVEEVQTTLAGLSDSVKTEMAIKLEREAVLERVRTIYRVVKQECMYMGGARLVFLFQVLEQVADGCSQ